MQYGTGVGFLILMAKFMDNIFESADSIIVGTKIMATYLKNTLNYNIRKKHIMNNKKL